MFYSDAASTSVWSVMLNPNAVAGSAISQTPRALVVQDLPDEAQVVRDGYKRTFDLVVIMLSHLLFLPFWLLLWTMIPLMIWLEDRGPVFYRQERLGQGGRRFTIFKFRTMIRNAEVLTGPVWASENDERATKVGRTLRRLRLDELPQVVNIVKGEMSLVGPRPERPFLAEQFDRRIPDFSKRLQVKPGVAGLAQLRGGYATKPQHKLKYDLLYIKRMSPWLDARLLLIAVPVTIQRWFTSTAVRENGYDLSAGESRNPVLGIQPHSQSR